ncbi:MAG: hypothetical protein LQ348_007464 [Seirophora lacunosa]|nr:MAG: hypothetical protein LQ348_007464 [Seirophora lacunosa]
MNVPLSSPPEERVLPSTLAGAFTGAAGGALRGRANIIPGIIMFSLFGYTGQRAYNFLDAPQPTPPPRAATADSPHPPSPDDDDDADQPLWKRVLNSKYSPMKVLSDEQYEHLLREKLVRVDAEIAIVDEQIGKVKARGGEDVGRGDREKA